MAVEVWANDPAEVRARFEAKMTDRSATITRRIDDYLRPRLDEIIAMYLGEGHGKLVARALAMNHCSEILIAAQTEVMADFDKSLADDLSIEVRTQKRMQAAKSNAGKIFERLENHVGRHWITPLCYDRKMSAAFPNSASLNKSLSDCTMSEHLPKTR